MHKMQIGDLAKIVEPTSSYKGEIVLKTTYGCISLHSSTMSWNVNSIVAVELLPKGTVITLTVQ